MDPESPRRASPQLAVVSEPHPTDHPVSGASPPDDEARSPGARSGAPRHPDTAAAAPNAASPLKVCAVEDSYSTLRIIFKVIKERGDEIDHFSQLEDAAAALRSGAYQVLVVSDSITGGAAACDALINWVRRSADPALAVLPIVALTAEDSAVRRGTLRTVGATTVLAGCSESRFQSALLAAVGHSPAPVEAPEPRRVCLLEDSYSLSLALSGILSQAGHDVEHFVQGSEALAAIRTRRYDLLVAGQDDGRADIACGSFIERARALVQATGAVLPVLVLTSDASPANVQALRRCGADRILTKNAVNLEQHILAFVAHGLASAERATPPREHSNASASVASPPSVPVPSSPMGASAAPPSAKAADPAPAMAPLSLSPAAAAVQSAALAGAAADFQSSSAAQPKPARTGTRFRLGWGIAVLLMLGSGVLLWQQLLVRTPVELVSAKLGTVSHSVGGTGYVVSKRQVDLPPPQAGQLYRVNAQEGNLVRKGEPLATLDNREALINVRRAEAQVYRFRTEIELADKTLREWRAQENQEVSALMVRDMQSSRALAAAKLRIAEQDLKAAQLAVDRLAVEAPFAGMITQSFAVEGKWVEPKTSLFTLADLESWEVAVRVKGLEAGDVTAGQTVRLSTEGAAGEEWTEKVLRVAGPGSATEAAGQPQGDAIVYVSLGDEAPAVEFGERVSAEIVTESVNKTVKVPYEAVVNRDGKTYVAMVEEQRVVYRPVEVGVRSLMEVEIVKGLSPGDQTILPRAPLAEGQRVKVVAVAETAELEGEAYPHREAFADVNVISTDDLRKQYDQVLVVDVRSKFEYDVVHIANAVNVPLSHEGFLAEIEKVRAKDDPRALVFYCNGHSCTKSYEAVQKAVGAGFGNVYAYDSGVFDWIREQSERTTLLGVTPASVRKIISEDYFQGRLINFDAFKRKSLAENAVVIDVRDAAQQTASLPLPNIHVPLDVFATKLEQGEFQGKQLLIFDAVGREVRWLQYILEDKGHEDYFFLRDGIAALNG